MKNSSGPKLFGVNDVIFIDHVLDLVLRLSLLCLRNEVAMCVVSSRCPVFTFASRPGVLFVVFVVLSCRILDSASLFILCSRTRSLKLWDVNHGNCCI